MSSPEPTIEKQPPSPLPGMVQHHSDTEALAPKNHSPSTFCPQRKRQLILWLALAFFLITSIALAIVLGVVLTRQQQQQQRGISSVNADVFASGTDKSTGASPHFSIETIGNLTALSKYAALTPMGVIENDAHFTMNTSSRVFVVGDVHGCVDELNALVKTIQYNYDAGDRMILVGDLVNKGPDSVGVIRRAKQLKALCVRGNHDDKVVRLATYVRRVSPSQQEEVLPEGPVYDPLLLGNKHMDIVKNMTDDDYYFLESCPMMIGIPSIGSLFVHAGIDPSKPLDNQEPYFVMNIRSITADGEAVKKSSDGEYPWSDVWNEQQRLGDGGTSNIYRKIYYGHAASRGLDLKEYSFGVDTGCVYGGNLTALEIKTGKISQVPCGTYSVKE